MTANELESKVDLNLYDFGARMQDMQPGRWMSIDPLAEKYFGISPYNYCGNNPVFYFDQDGMKIRNADEERKNKALESVNNVNKLLNNAREKFGSIDKRGDFKGTDAQ